LDLMNVWRETGVCGVPNQLKVQTALRKFSGEDRGSPLKVAGPAN